MCQYLKRGDAVATKIMMIEGSSLALISEANIDTPFLGGPEGMDAVTSEGAKRSRRKTSSLLMHYRLRLLTC